MAWERIGEDLHGRRKVIDLTGVSPAARSRQVKARQELEGRSHRLSEKGWIQCLG